MPRFLTSKLVLIGYLFTTVILTAHYNGNLKAATAVPKVTPKYTSLEDLVADDGTTILLHQGTAFERNLEVRSEDLPLCTMSHRTISDNCLAKVSQKCQCFISNVV